MQFQDLEESGTTGDKTTLLTTAEGGLSEEEE